VPVALLLYAGAQIPVKGVGMLVDGEGSVTGSPAHTGPIGLNVGITGLLTVTVTVLVDVQLLTGAVPVTV
jgi:hypothetical protein